MHYLSIELWDLPRSSQWDLQNMAEIETQKNDMG